MQATAGTKSAHAHELIMARFMFLELVEIVIVVLFRVHDLIVAAPNTRLVIRTNDRTPSRSLPLSQTDLDPDRCRNRAHEALADAHLVQLLNHNGRALLRLRRHIGRKSAFNFNRIRFQTGR